MKSVVDGNCRELVTTFIPEISDEDRQRDVADQIRCALEGASSVRDPEAGDVDLGARTDARRDPALGRFFAALARSWLASGPGRDLSGSLREELLGQQTEIVATVLIRSLLAELHIRRATGELDGRTPEERFDDFVAWLWTADGLRTVRARHPGAFAIAKDRADLAAAASVEVLDRLAADRSAIGAAFPDVPQDAAVASIGLGAGDPHRGGRSVALIRFGNGARLVYKPRSVLIDERWNAFLEVLNSTGITSLRTIAALDRGGYGYTEFVERDDAPPPGDPYVDGIGQLTAVLYLLRSTDIHYENLITSGGLPVIVDTETVLTPQPTPAPSYDAGAGSRLGRDELLDSVLRIGILPNLVSLPGREIALDIGAVGYRPGQTSPYRAVVLRNLGRDDMHTALGHVTSSVASANPVLTGGQDVRGVRDRMAAAFRATLLRVLQQRPAVARAMQVHFADVPIRYVHAPTIFYSQLLRMATHPDLLDSLPARATVLYRVCLREGETGHSLADWELADLLDGDVPYFWCRSDRRDVHHGRGPTLHGFFERSALALALDRLGSLDAAGIERQCWFLDLAFVNRIPTDREPTTLSTPADPAPRRPDRPGAALRIVRRIADAVAAKCCRATDPRHPATWVGPQVTTAEQRQWMPGTLGYDLYGGSVGVALFLAGAAAEFHDRSLADAAEAVLAPIEDQILDRRMTGTDVSTGGMTGMGGTVWALVHSRRLLGDAGLLMGRPRADADRDVRLLDLLGANVAPAGTPDFTSGLAGTLAVALDVEGASGAAPATDRIARALVEILTTDGFGVRGITGSRYTGYAHGLAGIAGPLLRWAVQRADRGVEALAAEYVGRLLDARRPDGDWPRSLDGDPGESSWAWCHGAPGILLGLLDVRRVRPDLVHTRIVADLVRLTRERAFGHNPTLCHGDLGSLDVLAMVARHEGDRDLDGFVDRTFHRLVDEEFVDVCRRRDSKYDFTNSLMVGTAGTGWSLLRRLYPERYPSVLAFGDPGAPRRPRPSVG